MRVGTVRSEQKIKMECVRLQRVLVKSLNGKDWYAALEASAKLRGRLEVMRRLTEAKETIRKIENAFRDLRRRDTKTVHGDYIEALRDLAVRLGFSQSQKPITHTAQSVIDKFNAELESRGLSKWDIPQWLLNGERGFSSLTVDEAQQLLEFHDFLLGVGKAEVSGAKQALQDGVNEGVKITTEAMPAKKSRYSGDWKDVVGSALGRWNFNISTLWLRMCGGDASNPAMQYLKEISYMQSRYDDIHTKVNKRVSNALKKLKKSAKTWDISGIVIPEGERSSYGRKLNADHLLMICLNMGTERNRKALINGFTSANENIIWSEETLADIAGRLSAEDWAQVQEIWDALSTLAPLVQEMNRKVYFCDIKLEEPVPVTVGDQTFRGGYFPLAYNNYDSKSGEVQKNEDGTIKTTIVMPKPSFVHERKGSGGNPVSLSFGVISDHIRDAAHFSTFFAGMQKILRIVKAKEFREKFQMTQGFRSYALLKKELEAIADPNKTELKTAQWVSMAKSAAAAAHLGLSIPNAIMQFGTLTVNLHKIKGHGFVKQSIETFEGLFRQDAFVPNENGTPLQRCLALSGLMRDRFQNKDADLRTSGGSLTTTKLGDIKRGTKSTLFLLSKVADMSITVPLWNAAYEQAIAEGAAQKEAIAEADSLVAASQGATRAMDLTGVQLDPLGKALAMYYTGANAQFNALIQAMYGMKSDVKKGNYKEAAGALIYTVIAPVVLSSILRYVNKGGFWGDDEEKARKSALREILAGPLSGLFLIRELADFTATSLVDGKTPNFGGFLQSPGFSVVEDVAFGTRKFISDGDIYAGAEALSTALGFPVLDMYDRLWSFLRDQTGDEAIPRIKPVKRKERAPAIRNPENYGL